MSDEIRTLTRTLWPITAAEAAGRISPCEAEFGPHSDHEECLGVLRDMIAPEPIPFDPTGCSYTDEQYAGCATCGRTGIVADDTRGTAVCPDCAGTGSTNVRTVDVPALWGGLLDGGYDEYNRRVGSRSDACGICGRAVVRSRAVEVHAVHGGATLLHVDDESRYVDDGGDMGCWLIGSTCAHLIPEGYSRPATPDRTEAALPVTGRTYATDRSENDDCEAGTPGCSILHTEDTGEGCETW